MNRSIILKRRLQLVSRGDERAVMFKTLLFVRCTIVSGELEKGIGNLRVRVVQGNYLISNIDHQSPRPRVIILITVGAKRATHARRSPTGGSVFDSTYRLGFRNPTVAE